VAALGHYVSSSSTDHSPGHAPVRVVGHRGWLGEARGLTGGESRHRQKASNHQEKTLRRAMLYELAAPRQRGSLHDVAGPRRRGTRRAGCAPKRHETGVLAGPDNRSCYPDDAGRGAGAR